jgi:hypothetical protein
MVPQMLWCYDYRHKDTQHNDIRYIKLAAYAGFCLCKGSLFVMLTVVYVDCDYAECHYAECCYAKCHSTQCHHADCHYGKFLMLTVVNARCQYAE